MKENKLLSPISIIGTTLTIAIIMAIVIASRVTIVPSTPESYRDRMLIFRYAGFQYKTSENWQSNGPVSYRTAKACFREMAVPETVTITSSFSETMLATRLTREEVSCSVSQVDDDFWKVFGFDFLSGYPFDKATFNAGATKAVISEDITRQLFGTLDTVGKIFLLNHSAYTICGVARPVSKLARYAYVQIRIPLSSTDTFTANWGGYGVIGIVSVYILAKSQDDFPTIRMEAERLRDRYMEGYPDYKLLYRGRPSTYFVAAQRYSTNNPPAAKQAVHQHIIALVTLLIVPTVSLSGLTLPYICKRFSEIGVRKALGTSKRELMIQIPSENMLCSLLDGVFRSVLNYGATLFLGSMLSPIDFVGDGVIGLRTVCMGLLFDPVVFLLAFSVCFTFNSSSTATPAWRTTRTDVVDAINER